MSIHYEIEFTLRQTCSGPSRKLQAAMRKRGMSFYGRQNNGYAAKLAATMAAHDYVQLFDEVLEADVYRIDKRLVDREERA